MSKAPPSFQFYPQDWLVGTAELSHSAKATYIQMLALSWAKAELVLDVRKLARMIGIEQSHFEADWEELRSKFTVDEDGYIYHEKLEVQRAEVFRRSQARQSAGRKGGLSKAKAMLKQCSSSLKSKDRSLKTKKDKTTDVLEDRFEQWWAAGRLKVGKARAKKHYEAACEKLRGREDVDCQHRFLLCAWETYQQSDRGLGEYAWEPCAWLRDGHYDDDPATWQHRGNGKAQKSVLDEVDLDHDPFAVPEGGQ